MNRPQSMNLKPCFITSCPAAVGALKWSTKLPLSPVTTTHKVSLSRPKHRTKIVVSVQQDPHPTPELNQLASWCKSSGVQFHSVSIRQQDENRGLFATHQIQPGEKLLSIPRQAALTTDATAPTPPPMSILKGIDPAFWKDAPWHVRLAVQLIDHRLDPQSRFQMYISALPSDPSCILWAYQVLHRSALSAQLARYHLQSAADVARAQCKHYYILLEKALPKHLRSLVTLSDFSWAVSICISRAFGLPPADGDEMAPIVRTTPLQHEDGVSIRQPAEYALFPGLDMANCSVRCKTSFKYDKDTDCYVVTTGANFDNGNQVFVSYGSKSNDELLLFYGFVEGSNPANSVALPEFRRWLSGVGHDDVDNPLDWDQKLQLLQEEKLTNPKKTYCFQLDKVDDGLMFALRIALANREELEIIRSTFIQDPKKETKSVSLRNELAVWKEIEKKSSSLLAENGSFDEKEQQRLEAMYENSPCTAPFVWGESGSDGELVYRYERQQVLSATISRVQHFASVSSAIGRVCTVLMPPSQSLLRADVFETILGNRDTSGVHSFSISPEDIQRNLDT